MLLLGKTFYKAQVNDGGSNGVSQIPIEIDLGAIAIKGDEPTNQELANAINNYNPNIIITNSDLGVFKVTYTKFVEEPEEET